MLGSAAALQTKPYNRAVIGIGNEFNGDDAAGVQVALRLLAEKRTNPDSAQPLILNGATAPENFTGVLRRYSPHVVLLIDAAEMGEAPGTMRVLDWRDSSGFGPSTHLQPLATLGEYLESELGCRVLLLGLQPAQLEFDAPLSPEVERAVGEVTAELIRILWDPLR